MTVSTLTTTLFASVNTLRGLARPGLAAGIAAAAAAPSLALRRAGEALSDKAAALAPVRLDLEAGLAATQSAANGLASVAGLLGEIAALLQAAKAPAADLASLQGRIEARVSALRTAAGAASAGGMNLLVGAGGSATFRGEPAGGGAFSISLDRGRTALFGTGAGLLERAVDLDAAPAPSLAGLDGPAVAAPGAAASAASATGGLAGTNTAVRVGVASADAGPARILVGTFNGTGIGSGDTVQLRLRVDGTAADVVLRLRAVSDAPSMQTELQRALDAAFGSGAVVASVAADGTMALEGTRTGSGRTLSLDSVTRLDGDDVTTGTLGLVTQSAYSTTTAPIGGQTRTYDGLGVPDFSTIDRADRLRFKIGANANGTVGEGTITVGLAGVSDAASLAAALNAAIARDPAYGNFAGATLVGGEVAVYLKTTGVIRVTEITALNGDGTVTGNPGFATASGAGRDAVAAVAASATTGSDFTGPVTLAPGATLGFDLSRDGTPTRIAITSALVEAALAGTAGYLAGSGTIGTIGQLASVAQAALGAAGITEVAVAVSGNRLAFTRTGTPASGQRIAVGAVSATAAPARAASLTTGSDFAGPLILDAAQSITFELAVDSDAAVPVVIDRASVAAALGGDAGFVDGRIGDADAFARVVQQALTEAGIADVAATAAGQRLQLTKTVAGAGSLALGAVTGSGGPAVATRLDTIDLAGAGFAGLDAGARSAKLDALLAGVEALARSVSAARAHVASVAAQLGIQARYLAQLTDVAADLGAAPVLSTDAARASASQVRRGLAQTSVSIMNQAQLDLLPLLER